MKKQELFSYVQKFNGVCGAELIRIPNINYYCHNYYQTDDDYLLYAHSDDGNYTSWYLCDKDYNELVCFGESFTSDGDIIEVFDDIRYMDFYGVGD